MTWCCSGWERGNNEIGWRSHDDISMTNDIHLTLSVLPATYAVCCLDHTARAPGWVLAGDFISLTRTPNELSIVVLQSSVPDDVTCERDWRILQVQGPLDFGLTGILAALAQPLADAGIPIFAVSTYSTDYVLVKAHRLKEALDVLRASGHHVIEDSEG